MPAKKSTALTKTSTPLARRGTLLGDVSRIITAGRDTAGRAVDAAHLLTNWQVGRRILQDILKTSARSMAAGSSRRCRDN